MIAFIIGLIVTAIFMLGYWCGTGHNERKAYRAWQREQKKLPRAVR